MNIHGVAWYRFLGRLLERAGASAIGGVRLGGLAGKIVPCFGTFVGGVAGLLTGLACGAVFGSVSPRA